MSSGRLSPLSWFLPQRSCSCENHPSSGSSFPRSAPHEAAATHPLPPSTDCGVSLLVWLFGFSESPRLEHQP